MDIDKLQKDTLINSLAKKRLKKLTNEEIEKKANIEKKKTRTYAISLLITSILILIANLAIIIALQNESWDTQLGVSIGTSVTFVTCSIISFVYSLINFKKLKRITDIKDWALTNLEIEVKEELEEKARIQAELDEQDPNKIDGKLIKKVILIDSYTEYTDKLHAFLNFQEIIQTRYYKFNVTFMDNSSSIYTVKEDSKDYNKLIFFLNNDLGENNIKTSNNTQPKNSSAADEIRKYKELMDEGIISKEEFEDKKKELLKK